MYEGNKIKPILNNKDLIIKIQIKWTHSVVQKQKNQKTKRLLHARWRPPENPSPKQYLHHPTSPASTSKALLLSSNLWLLCPRSPRPVIIQISLKFTPPSHILYLDPNPFTISHPDSFSLIRVITHLPGTTGRGIKYKFFSRKWVENIPDDTQSLPILGTKYVEHPVWQGRKTTRECVLREVKAWSCRSRGAFQSSCVTSDPTASSSLNCPCPAARHVAAFFLSWWSLCDLEHPCPLVPPAGLRAQVRLSSMKQPGMGLSSLLRVWLHTYSNS